MMKKNIQSLLKRDLELFPLIAYFVFYFLYLFFDKILEQKDYAILVKPIIIPIIVFLYLTNKKSKRTIVNLFLLMLIFISDNSTLLEIRSFHIYATIIYIIVLFILLNYALLDMKYVAVIQNNKNKLSSILCSVFIITFFYSVFNLNPNSKTAEKFIVFEHIIVCLLLFKVSFINYLKLKSNKTKYLFLSILCLLLSEFCFSMQRYYNAHIVFKYIFCIVEIPVYYFLLKYLLLKDKESIEQ